ncbi:MAG: glycosyltransferase family 2 protein [Desulfamplus sp.]|nr:glycosyltransferase family 2 protein [Desulfamplus sp.]
MSLEINIIYSPGVVKFLSFFVWSLLKWSDCSFRLVANGCLPPERRFLKKFCEQDDRLEFWCIPTKGHLAHGEAINYLHALTHGDYFCFMDSDIIATGEFLTQPISYLDSHTGVFTGTPLWIKSEEEILSPSFQIVSGHHQVTENAIPLGSTYFALYDNKKLTTVIQNTGVGFQRYVWEEIPHPFQSQLTKAGLSRKVYDTGKLLNFLLFVHNEPLIFFNSNTLSHLGGVGIRAFHNKPKGWKHRLLDRLPAKLSDRLKHFHFNISFLNKTKGMSISDIELKAIFEQRQQHRDTVRYFFWQLLVALFKRESVPSTPITGDYEIDAKVSKATKNIITMFEEFSDKIDIGAKHG